jgi:hypothetical protein
MLAPHFLLPQPDELAILQMMDKLELARMATQLAITTPLTLSCRSAEDLDNYIGALQFRLSSNPLRLPMAPQRSVGRDRRSESHHRRFAAVLRSTR